jgi:hydroxymethylpyrimidine pyrophosphatase-like HAD family hydrolase
MRYLALATDYDGTLAADGRVSPATLDALRKLRESGRRLLLVTGRVLPELLEVFPELAVFDRVVAENGALLYDPKTKEEKLLCEPAPGAFVERLRARGVPLSVGRAIVATVTPHEAEVLAAIKELGLELHVIFNKGAVMVLPSGMNKRVGLEAALAELQLSAHNVVGVGDAENDHAFLTACECGVAVANALDALKQRADLVMAGARGEGVQELATMLLADDLEPATARLERHRILLGKKEAGAQASGASADFWLEPHGGSVMIAGPSQSGKSTVTTGLVERLCEQGYQFCLVDPEGDYAEFEGAVSLGDAQHAPAVDEVLQVLADPAKNVSMNLLGVPLPDRPLFFTGLLPRLLEMRVKTGRPHWIVVDEAHHLLPSAWVPAPPVPEKLQSMLLITMQPEHVAAAALEPVKLVLAVGREPQKIFAGFAHARKISPPNVAGEAELEPGEVLAWAVGEKWRPVRVRTERAKSDLKRHVRKYAEGELAPERSFYFRGPENKLNLRAYNLTLFSQLAEGVDEATWEFHLRRGDYSRWFRNKIKDPELAADAEQIERARLAPQESRERVLAAIQQRYTAAA